MDGNGRWARKRLMPRVAGHNRGVETLRRVIKACIETRRRVPDGVRIQFRELAAPAGRVSFLMNLFVVAAGGGRRLHRSNGIAAGRGRPGRFEPRS